MFKLGQTQELEVVKVLDFGCYLSEDSMGFERVLLPRKQVPTGTVVGNILEVFIYKDSQDRLIATTNTPLITLGKTALLKVKAVSRIGAFLDWGLEKDLLLPYKEQSKSLKEGRGSVAYSIIDINTPATQEVIDKLNNAEGVWKVRVVK